jgi:hypothetical protein
MRADTPGSVMSRSPSSAAPKFSALPVSAIGRTGRGVVFAGIAERFLDAPSWARLGSTQGRRHCGERVMRLRD